MKRLTDTPRAKHPLNLSRMNKLEDQIKDVARGFDRLGHQDLAAQADRVASELRALWGMVLAVEAAERGEGRTDG